MQGIISVIIPVYNVVTYLAECVNSVRNQSYDQLEIILVDDGSTDGSGELCDEFAQNDSRIIVIHKKNGGAANAKNVGLRIAKGEFLSFVDSDDFLEEDAYTYMVQQLRKYQADVIQCGFRNKYRDMSVDCVTLNRLTFFSKIEYLRRFTEDWTCGLLWDKLYHRRIFDGIEFEEGHKIDDEYFTYQGIMNAECILHSPRIVYNYRKRKSSVIVQKESQQKIVLDKLDYLEKRRLKIVEKYPELKQEFDYHFLSMLVILSKDVAATEKSIRITKQMLQQYLKEKPQCKMEFSLKKQLFMLKHKSVDKILQNRHNVTTVNEESHWFE